MSISLIAVDIDGTLLNGNSELSIENLEAIKRLSKRGIMTVPVTGRTYNEIPQTLRSCEDIQYFVYSNGSGIYEKEEQFIPQSCLLKPQRKFFCC